MQKRAGLPLEFVDIVYSDFIHCTFWLTRDLFISLPPDTTTTRASNSTGSVLRERNFRFYYAGIWFSTTAFWILKIAIGWAAWELSHSVFWTGVVAACYLLPAFVLSPLFGVLADRISLKHGVQAVSYTHLTLPTIYSV